MKMPEVVVDRSIPKALRAFDADRLRWLDEAAAVGPVVALRFGRLRTWVVTDPAIARTMLIADAASWERPPAAIVPIRLGVGENLFTQSDDAWALLQPQIAPAFRKRALGERLGDMGPIIDDSVAAIADGRVFDVELEMGALALRLAAWVLFGDQLPHDRAVTLAQHQRDVVTWVGHRMSGLLSVVPFATGRSARAMRRHRRELDAYADELIARRRNDPSGPSDDTLALLLQATPGGVHLDAKALRTHVLGMLLAGNETTAAALAWTLVNAAEHPSDWARVATDPAMADGFLDETMRLTPAVWGFARRPKRRDATIEGTPIGRTELVTIYLRGINRSERFWSDARAFRPARHATPTDESATALIPFGLGPRGCIGQHLATAELRATLPVLARVGDVHVDGEVALDASFALRVRGGLRAHFVPRS